ncbi:MAG: hypothetical protein NDF54_07385 [archaeon GB-1867-035]|nr:hypothetical protein [Candidatus Culexmicrobium profundum]
MFEHILIGLYAGLAYGTTGYLKSLKKDGSFEKFDPYKFLQSIIVGGVSGVISAYMGWTLEAAQEFVLNTGMVALIENVKKFLWRKFFKKLIEFFQ